MNADRWGLQGLAPQRTAVFLKPTDQLLMMLISIANK